MRDPCGNPALSPAVRLRPPAPQYKLFLHFYHSEPMQRALRGGRAAERREEEAWAAQHAAAPGTLFVLGFQGF